MKSFKLYLKTYSPFDINFENISGSLEFTIFPMVEVGRNMYAKTGSGQGIDIATPIDLYDLMGATGTIDEVKAKIIKSWENKNYVVIVVDEDGNPIED